MEKFIDTPVKHYSSGMGLRLGFAVAAHLEPEILVVDEVLAVGDAEFQKKCLGKMGEVAGEGRTVLFVSHNMAAIQKLCQSTILLHQGNLIGMGLTETVINQYLKDTSPKDNEVLNVQLQQIAPYETFELQNFRVFAEKNGERQKVFATHFDIVVELKYKIQKK